VWRFALSRRWWAGHVLVAVFSVVFLGLARWQWDRAHSAGGDWQNFGYALQWPVFAIFLVAGWLRFLWLEQHQCRDGVIEGERPVPAPPPAARAARGRVPRPIPEDEPDDELAAYNAYLARLAEQDRRS
jgi:DNA-binding transcriptional regulator of glucitol operon